VSRQHAKLIKQNGGWAVVDLNSTNYTRVDGNKLEPNVPVPVGDGSRIQLGRIVVVLRQ
jgi:pSer/pThr/pTyr-binding forkhead associated (FHA) protein